MVQVISTVGFPIVCVLGMAWFFYQVWLKQEERNKQREEKLMDIVRELSGKLAELGQIVDKNTEVLSVLTEKVATLEEKLEGK